MRTLQSNGSLISVQNEFWSDRSPTKLTIKVEDGAVMVLRRKYDKWREWEDELIMRLCWVSEMLLAVVVVMVVEDAPPQDGAMLMSHLQQIWIPHQADISHMRGCRKDIKNFSVQVV